MPAAAPGVARAAIVFLHGSGDTGAGIEAWLKHVWRGRFAARARENGIELHFPTATPRPYKLAGGQISSVWFDRHGLPPEAPEHTESVEDSCRGLEKQIDAIIARGVPAHRIAIGGFSMGGGIAMQCMLRSPHRLGACFALSSFLCERAAIYERLDASAARATHAPVYIRHGGADDFILPAWGRATADKLRSLGLAVDYGEVPGVRHELSDASVAGLSAWLLPKLTAVDEAGAPQRAASAACDGKPSATGEAGWRLGAPVRLTGLQKAAHHNGKRGRLGSAPADATARVAVHLDEGGAPLSVRRENLELADEEATDVS
jgi:phospholipase/carboxylesterase